MKGKKSENVSNEMVISEIASILKELGYSDENWISDFIQDFLVRGIDAIHAYESRFGNRDIKKLKNKIQLSKTLNIYNSDSLSKIASVNDNKKNPTLLDRANSYPNTNSLKVSEKEALSELKFILNNLYILQINKKNYFKY